MISKTIDTIVAATKNAASPAVDANGYCPSTLTDVTGHQEPVPAKNNEELESYANNLRFWGDFDPAQMSDESAILAVSGGAPVIVNLETPLTTQPIAVAHLHPFRGSPDSALLMRRANVIAACVANNHTLDCGFEGLRETVDCLKRAGVAPFGYLNDDGASVPAIVTIINQRVGLLGYVEFGAPIQPIFSLSRAKADIATLCKRCVRVVIYIHGGVEYVSTPSPAQSRISRALIDAGAHLILWCHSHVRASGERYRDGYICYGLGNSFFYTPEQDRYRAANEGIEVSLGGEGQATLEILRRSIGLATPLRAGDEVWREQMVTSHSAYLAAAGPVYIGSNARSFIAQFPRHPFGTAVRMARWLVSRMFWRMVWGCALAPFVKRNTSEPS